MIYYEIDDEEVETVLRAADYGGDEDGAWVLLELVEAEVEAEAAAAAGSSDA